MNTTIKYLDSEVRIMGASQGYCVFLSIMVVKEKKWKPKPDDEVAN